MAEPKYPEVEVQLSGQDGNAFMMIARARTALRRHVVSAEEVDEFTKEAAKSGDYNNVIATIGRWVTVS